MPLHKWEMVAGCNPEWREWRCEGCKNTVISCTAPYSVWSESEQAVMLAVTRVLDGPEWSSPYADDRWHETVSGECEEAGIRWVLES